MTSVKWQGEMLPVFINQQEVRQGGVLSAGLYMLFIYDLLDRLEATGKGAKIGNIDISVPTCADDVTKLSNDSEGLQFLISLCKDSSNLNGYVLHYQKSAVLKMNSIRQYPENEAWTLEAKEMPIVQETTHMGVRDSKQLSAYTELLYYHSRRLLFVLHAARYIKKNNNNKTKIGI